MIKFEVIFNHNEKNKHGEITQNLKVDEGENLDVNTVVDAIAMMYVAVMFDEFKYLTGRFLLDILNQDFNIDKTIVYLEKMTGSLRDNKENIVVRCEVTYDEDGAKNFRTFTEGPCKLNNILCYIVLFSQYLITIMPYKSRDEIFLMIDNQAKNILNDIKNFNVAETENNPQIIN